MYCKFCSTEIKPIDTFLTGAYCTGCEEIIENRDMQEDRPTNSEPVIDTDWWKDKSNFPCIITYGSDYLMMALIHYCIDDIAYDCRNNSYRLKHTNWRRATKQEILNNIKGL